MPEFPSATESLRAPPGAAAVNGADTAADPFETAAAAHAELAAADDARTQLRRVSDKAELRLALRDLAEGLRGMIRVAPLASVAAAVGFGMLLNRRRRPRPRRLPPPPPRRG
jgi:hypothetical protein